MLAALAAGALYRAVWLRGAPAAADEDAHLNTPTDAADPSLCDSASPTTAPADEDSPFFGHPPKAARPSQSRSFAPHSQRRQFNAAVHRLFPQAVTMCDEEVAALVVDNGSGMCKVKPLKLTSSSMLAKLFAFSERFKKRQHPNQMVRA